MILAYFDSGHQISALKCSCINALSLTKSNLSDLGSLSGRILIINGAMRIAQRGTSNTTIGFRF